MKEKKLKKFNFPSGLFSFSGASLHKDTQPRDTAMVRGVPKVLAEMAHLSAPFISLSTAADPLIAILTIATMEGPFFGLPSWETSGRYALSTCVTAGKVELPTKAATPVPWMTTRDGVSRLGLRDPALATVETIRKVVFPTATDPIPRATFAAASPDSTLRNHCPTALATYVTTGKVELPTTAIPVPWVTTGH